MGNLNASMGYVVNDDGSITRINSIQHQSSHSPNFIPLSLSRYRGSTKRFWFFLAFIVIFFINGFTILLGIGALERNDQVNHYYEGYIRCRNENDKDWADSYYESYEYAKKGRIIFCSFAVVFIVGSIILDCRALPRLRTTYPSKKKVLKGVEYIQSDLLSNHRYPYIMTNNLIGVFSMRKGKIIIPPNYDDIRWVISKKVFCAKRQGKKMFYDINGDILNNVPQSYYNS